jgi:ribonucleotide reductase alpha subunit
MNLYLENFTSDILPLEFLSTYVGRNPEWGFAGLGYIVYKRTYARLLPDGKTTEEWWQTVARCVNGAQKLGAGYTAAEAQRLYDLVFNLKCNFAGRMLWQLGTTTVDRFGANSLLNCWYTALKKPQDFCFLFENLMLGGGVGYSVKKEDIHELPKIHKNVVITHQNTKDASFIVPDSREGWVSLLQNILDSYFITGKSFTYSTILVRGAGERIEGFGGTASGPVILIEGMRKICTVLQSREGKKLRSIDVLDIANIIGSIVVAGNVRRSAQISIGDPDDFHFLRAKRWDLGNIPNWRAMSNNTIGADNYEQISDNVWDGFKGNGEPYGLFNLPLALTTGRLGENRRDYCEGTNPCVTGDMLVDVYFPDSNVYAKVTVVDIVAAFLQGTRVSIRSFDTTQKHQVYSAIAAAAMTQKNAKILKITDTKTGKQIRVTEDHLVYTQNRGYVRAQDLAADDVLLLADETLSNSSGLLIIEDDGFEDVYDFTVPDVSNFYINDVLVHNCAEILLADKECCNLSELYLNNLSSLEEMIEAASLLYKCQKAICALPFIHPETTAIVHKNMRIGVGVTGVCQSLDKMGWLDPTYQALRKLDKSWSKQQGWPESIRLTTVKPSGSLSLLAGATPGVHPGFSRHFIRRIRMSSGDSLVNICRNIGYHVEYAKNFDGSLNHDTVVVSFPCEYSDQTVLAQDMRAVDQLELVKKMQTLWSDNSVSVTVYYRKNELPEIRAWLQENYATSLKTVSFLLHSEHGFAQAPYEEITLARYQELKKRIKPLTDVVIQYSAQDLEDIGCETGVCPIK